MIRLFPIALIGASLLGGAAAPAASARQQQAPEVCDCEVQRPATIAVVNNVSIATTDLDADTAELVDRLRQLMGQVREQALQRLVTDRLVALEAAKRGVTSARLIHDEVVAKAADPTEAELRDFYARNAAGFEGKSFADVQENLRSYIRAQRQQVQLTIFTTDLRSAATVQILEYSPAAPATEVDRSKVLATVNDSKITSADLEDSIRNQAFNFRHQVWAIQRDALDIRIDSMLIEQEARKRGMTTDALVAAEVAPKTKKVDAFDASKFYNDNKDQFGGRPFADVKDDLIKFLQQKEAEDARHAYAEPLRKAATIKDSLIEPAPPTYEIATAGRPTLGAQAAPVTVVIFSDFECPRCKTVHGRIDEIVKAYAGKVKIVARNYPLEQHPVAHKAAEAAEAAAEQGKYWEYADLVFANQATLSPEKLKEFATQLGLDRAKFDAALDSGKFAALVDRDLDEGARVGVQGTPAVYVNGIAVSDDSSEGLKAAIDEALKPRG